MKAPTDCMRCEAKRTAETGTSVVVLCYAAYPPVVVMAFPRKVRLSLETVAPRAGCPRRTG